MKINKFKSMPYFILALFLFSTLQFSGCSLSSSDNTYQTTQKSTITAATSSVSEATATVTTASTTVATIPDNQSKPSESQTSNASGTLKVSYIDVGQADSILVQQGTSSMLIDAGTNEASEKVKNYIASQGVTKLDYVVGTHPHEDHIGGLDVAINSFQVGTVYMPKITNTTKTFTDVVKAIKNKGLQAVSPKAGETFKLGEASCTVLAPNSSKYEDLNNYSIVIKVTFGNNSFMFDGDAEDVSEKEMLSKGFDVKADVLKVGHHGSSSSTTEGFLNAVNPKYAVISVGKGNTYGHPHESTMNRLKAHNIAVYRTDECGTIVAISDGNNITFN